MNLDNETKTSTNVELAEFRRVARQAAQSAGEVLLAWREKFTVEEKAASDLVTDADRAAQSIVFDTVRNAFPDHGFIGEESHDPSHQIDATANPGGYQWVVDPLDGTTNYVHGVPFYCVSIALAKDNHPLVAAIYDPNAGEMFEATDGGGATLNDQLITASGKSLLAEALLSAGFPPSVQRDSAQVRSFVEMLVRCRAIRRTGSTALNLCYVAVGRFDGFWTHATNPWDMAAGVLIAKEAGASSHDLYDQPLDIFTKSFVTTASPELYREMLPWLVG